MKKNEAHFCVLSVRQKALLQLMHVAFAAGILESLSLVSVELVHVAGKAPPMDGFVVSLAVMCTSNQCFGCTANASSKTQLYSISTKTHRKSLMIKQRIIANVAIIVPQVGPRLTYDIVECLGGFEKMGLPVCGMGKGAYAADRHQFSADHRF